MKPLLLTAAILLACGPTFTAEETPIGQEQDPPATSGHSGTLASAGTSGVEVSSGGLSDVGGKQSANGGMANSLAGADAGGNPPMAGGGEKPIANCLGGSDCARDCTRDQTGSDCQQALICWSQGNSFDNCSQFTSLGLTLAKDAVLNCGCR